MHLVVQAPQPLAQLLADLGVQAPNGSSSSSTVGLHGQGPGQRHPLPLPAGELGRQPVRELREVHQLEQLGDLALDGLGLDRLRISRPKATFLATLMCLKAA